MLCVLGILMSPFFFFLEKDEVFRQFLYYGLFFPMGVEHSGEGIFGRRSHNAKFFERIEHSGGR